MFFFAQSTKCFFFSDDHEFCEACTVVATPFINCRQAAIMNGDCDSTMMDEDDLEECIEDECYDELTGYHACEYSSPDCGKCPRHVLFFSLSSAKQKFSIVFWKSLKIWWKFKSIDLFWIIFVWEVDECSECKGEISAYYTCNFSFSILSAIHITMIATVLPWKSFKN